MTYRNRKLLDLAHKLNTCTSCEAYIPEGLEPAHSDSQRHGKGTGHKAADNFHAAICHNCHLILGGNKLNRQLKQDMWQFAHDKTMTEYFERGWIKNG